MNTTRKLAFTRGSEERIVNRQQILVFPSPWGEWTTEGLYDMPEHPPRIYPPESHIEALFAALCGKLDPGWQVNPLNDMYGRPEAARLPGETWEEFASRGYPIMNAPAFAHKDWLRMRSENLIDWSEPFDLYTVGDDEI